MSRGRPRPRALVRIDPENPYARIGVSPAASNEEIKQLLDLKRRDAVARARDTGDTRGEEAMRLQELTEIIGKPERRTAYDRLHPWNELLTVQMPPSSRALESPYRAALVTAALVEELGPEPLLPSAQSLALWAPAGLPEELRALLAVPGGNGDAARSADATPSAATTMLSPEELDKP